MNGFKPGDRVIGSCGHGGMADKLVIAEANCITMPTTMPFDIASALVLTYGTSMHALKDRANIKPGESLLVLGAAGGVGPFRSRARQSLRRARHCRGLFARKRSRSPGEHGADTGVVYPSGPFDKAGTKALSDLFKQACGPNGADVIYDPVGGDYSEAALRAIAWEGRLLVVGFPAGIARLPLNLTLLKSCQIVGVFWGGFARRDPKANAANIAELMQLYAKGAIKPLISERYPLARPARPSPGWRSARQWAKSS